MGCSLPELLLKRKRHFSPRACGSPSTPPRTAAWHSQAAEQQQQARASSLQRVPILIPGLCALPVCAPCYMVRNSLRCSTGCDTPSRRQFSPTHASAVSVCFWLMKSHPPPWQVALIQLSNRQEPPTQLGLQQSLKWQPPPAHVVDLGQSLNSHPPCIHG